MKVPSSSRSRSGLAWASCSSSRRAGSILGVTVIVVSFFESVFADHSKDHAVAVAYAGDTLTGSRTPLNCTSLKPGGPRLGHAWVLSLAGLRDSGARAPSRLSHRGGRPRPSLEALWV